MEYRNFRKITGTKLYRGSGPDFLNDNQKEKLEKDYGIKCVIDLRSPVEYIFRDPKQKGNLKFKNYNFMHISAQDFFRVLWKESPFYMKCLYLIFTPILLVKDLIFGTIQHYRMVQLYATVRNGLFGYTCDMVNHCGKRINAALTLLCSEENIPALIVCSLGKDRTGLVSAILQSLCDVPEDTIRHDYTLSKNYGYAQYNKPSGKLFGKLFPAIYDAKPDMIIDVLRFIEHKYGSVSGYLESIGFDKAKQSILIKNIKENN